MTFTREALQSLLGEHQPPCVTLYVPTQRAQSEWNQNAIRFKNLLREADKALAANKEWKAAGAAVLDKIAKLDAPDLWAQPRDTLVVFANPDRIAHWQVAEALPETCVVADSYYTKGLVKALQGDARYYVLALTIDNITLFEGSHNRLDIVTVPGMPRGLRDLESKLGEPVTAGHGGHTASATFGGSRETRTEVVKDEAAALFRMVDRALLPLTHDQRAPLILAALSQHQGLFREVSKNPALLDERIDGDPKQLKLDDLRKRALEILEPKRERILRELADQWGAATAHKRGTNYLPNIAQAALRGRVQTLLIEDGREVFGRLDRETGEISGMSATATPGAQDLIDDVSELVLAAGGHVYVLPKRLMPTNVGVAAIYRY